jgi:hypothetical protein
MLNNVDVYSLADKVNIAELKTLAQEKFRQDADNLPVDNLARVAHEVYASTPNGDRGLRDIVTRLCADLLPHIVQDDEVTMVLEDAAGFAYDVLQLTSKMYMKSLDSVKQLRRTIAAQKLEIKNNKLKESRIKQEHLISSRELKAIREQLGKAINQARNRRNCPSCLHLTRGILQWKDRPSKMDLIMKCEYCNCYFDITTSQWIG